MRREKFGIDNGLGICENEKLELYMSSAGYRQELRLFRWVFSIKPLLLGGWQVHQMDWDKKRTEGGRFEKEEFILQMRRQNVHYCKSVLCPQASWDFDGAASSCKVI